MEEWKNKFDDGAVISEEKREEWGKPSIYKISSVIKNQNKNAYEPQIVSFGPYHHHRGRINHLETMEKHKNRAVLHFLRRCGKSIIGFVCQEMGKVLQELKDSYETLDDPDDNRFLQLMIADGCFMLEILRASEKTAYDDDDDYAENDPVFGNHGKISVMPYIKRDMLLLENQLPILVLQILTKLQTGKPQLDDDDNELLNNRILKFLSPPDNTEGNEEESSESKRKSEKKAVKKEKRFGKCVHALDLYRKCLINTDQTKPNNSDSNHHQFLQIQFYRAASRSATELHEYGIQFCTSNNDRSLDSVSFQKHWTGAMLCLPHLVVDDTTESMFLNFIAFESLHVGADNQVLNV
ncbi:hypothetical protein PIB30_046982 [Stylosanthes scabra]|uniref:Uncharacterized protein n=1 Tax=Stylosanthes scabra TaxID=79078 RepID=A0ABU6UFW7_9FABA|nr:hypothetical protein [Stylosanthes scabra]